MPIITFSSPTSSSTNEWHSPPPVTANPCRRRSQTPPPSDSPLLLPRNAATKQKTEPTKQKTLFSCDLYIYKPGAIVSTTGPPPLQVVMKSTRRQLERELMLEDVALIEDMPLQASCDKN